MDQSQPYFTLHNGQIRLVNAPQNVKESKMLDSSFYVDDEEMSLTSSTMSDDFSLGEEEVEDDESFYESDEEELDLDIPLRRNALGGIGRSTVSLDAALLKGQRQQPDVFCANASMPVMSIPQQMAVARTKSMASMALARQHLQQRAAGCDHAWQQTSAQEHQQPQQQLGPASAALAASEATNPNEHLAKLLQINALKTVNYDSLHGYFLHTQPEHIAAWDANLLRAIRTHDLALIKEMHQSGKPLQACNRFKESILHVCVRRGTPEILEYLLEQGQVSPRVCCDYGRTALHDAAWVLSNDKPRSFEMMALLLKRCPEMLLIADKRGFTPLNYVPKDRWASCCEFLNQHTSLLRERLKKQPQKS